MSNPTPNRQARRAAKITGAMIDHGVAILEATDDSNYVHDEGEGEFACPGCVTKCLRRNWGSAVQKPTSDEHWEVLGQCVLDVVIAETNAVVLATAPSLSSPSSHPTIH
jgi:hypothetical protein